MSYKINDLEYLGSVNLARIFEDPETVVAKASDAAFHVDRLWFYKLLPGDPSIVTEALTLERREKLRRSCEDYGGSGVIDLDLRVNVSDGSPWYVISVEKSDHGPAVSVYIPEGALPEGIAAVRAAWEAGQ